MAENQQEYPGVVSYTVNVKVHALHRCVCAFVDRDQPLCFYFYLAIMPHHAVLLNFTYAQKQELSDYYNAIFA